MRILEKLERLNDGQNSMDRLYFVGPKWQIDLLKPIYGDCIDYYEQQKIPDTYF